MANRNPTDAQRLEALRVLLTEVACSIRNLQAGLKQYEGTDEMIYLAADALGRIGWVADQGRAVAGDDSPGIVEDARAWLLSPLLLEALDCIA